MIKVLVNGASGRMGSEVVRMVRLTDDLVLSAIVDPAISLSDGFRFGDLKDALNLVKPDVMVDFTRPEVVEDNIKVALEAGVNCVIGTTGLSPEKLAELEQLIPEGVCLFVAPNFAIGAVLLMKLASIVAPYMPDVEIIEMHHEKKIDAPSGTALRTAELISEARGEFTPTQEGINVIEIEEGARGGMRAGVPVHSVRLPGYVAHQEVIFGGKGQTLTIRHDSIDRSSFMPGVEIAIRGVMMDEGLIVGLENFLG